MWKGGFERGGSSSSKLGVLGDLLGFSWWGVSNCLSSICYVHTYIYIYICLNFYPFLPSSFFLNNKFYLSLQVLLLGLGFFDSLFSVLSPIPLGVSQQLWCLATWRVKPQQSLWPIWPECVNAALMWMLW